MKAPDFIEDLARTLFVEIHTRLGHDEWVLGEKTRFDSDTQRHDAWVMIATVFLENKITPGRWMDDYAFALFTEVHQRLGNGTGMRLDRDGFESIPPRRKAWYEIARVLDERRVAL